MTTIKRQPLNPDAIGKILGECFRCQKGHDACALIADFVTDGGDVGCYDDDIDGAAVTMYYSHDVDMETGRTVVRGPVMATTRSGGYISGTALRDLGFSADVIRDYLWGDE